MKLLLLTLLLPVVSYAQILGLGKKIPEYKASNGKTYHVGDSIKTGRGSAPDGTFRYIQYGGWTTLLDMGRSTDSHNVERNASGYVGVIKKYTAITRMENKK